MDLVFIRKAQWVTTFKIDLRNNSLAYFPDQQQQRTHLLTCSASVNVKSGHLFLPYVQYQLSQLTHRDFVPFDKTKNIVAAKIMPTNFF